MVYYISTHSEVLTNTAPLEHLSTTTLRLVGVNFCMKDLKNYYYPKFIWYTMVYYISTHYEVLTHTAPLEHSECSITNVPYIIC